MIHGYKTHWKGIEKNFSLEYITKPWVHRVYVMLSTWTLQHVTFNFPTERKEHLLDKWIRPNIRQTQSCFCTTNTLGGQSVTVFKLTSGGVYRSVFNISSLKECSGFNASFITRLTKKKKTRPTFHSNALCMIHNE